MEYNEDDFEKDKRAFKRRASFAEFVTPLFIILLIIGAIEEFIGGPLLWILSAIVAIIWIIRKVLK